MTGLEAISAHNGWNIAVVGVTIVFTGLTLLSIIISQLHKVLDLWENRGKFGGTCEVPPPGADQEKEIDLSQLPLAPDIRESARHVRMLVDRLGEPFSLPRLLESAETCGLMRPHSTLNDLIGAEVIVPDGTGYYFWNSSVSR